MKPAQAHQPLSIFLGLMLVLFTWASPAVLLAAEGDDDEIGETDLGWPREVKSDGDTILLYQPQLEKWENNKISGRAAVSITTKANAQPSFGVIWLSARTEVNKEKDLVRLEDFKIIKANFPAYEDGGKHYREILEKQLTPLSWTIALDRLKADIEIAEAELKTAPSVPLKNDPPRVVFSAEPAALILVDGKPALRKVEGFPYQRVVNTRALILFDEAKGHYYLHAGNAWVTAKKLEGPWETLSQPPEALNQLREKLVANRQVDQPEEVQNIPAKNIHVSTTPAELIQTEGKPEIAPITGSSLLYVKNTTNDLFFDPSTQHYYVLISGRWFRTQSLEKKWQYVPGKSLPAEFAKISEKHPKGDVLAAIPETPQAKEAEIENSIPQTAAVSRQEASFSPTYDGQAQFKKIDSTPLYYAVNSPMPVIRVDEYTYYAVQNGVWFSGTSPTGPWVVAEFVPAVIYTIPPSSPLHYVTYVKVYGATPEVVYVGYTPGYLGSCVSAERVVVYGTGWHYPAYVGAFWIGYPVTYGFHVHYHWTSWYGWGWGFGWGLGWAPVYYPWWGPFWGGHHHHHHHHHHGSHVTVNNYYNVNQINVYNRWEKKVVRSSHPRVVSQPLQAGNRRGRGGTVAARPAFQPGSSKLRRENNVYAGRDGQVYRRSSKGWEQNQGNKWRPVENDQQSVSATRPSVSAPASEPRRNQAPQGQRGPVLQEKGPKEVPRQLVRPPAPKSAEPSRALEREHRARNVGEERWRQHAQPERVQPQAPRAAPPRAVAQPPRTVDRGSVNRDSVPRGSVDRGSRSSGGSSRHR